MNFSPQTKAWMLLICMVMMTGGAIFTTSYLGGAKWWIALICAITTAASNVYHALNSSPKDEPEKNPKP